MAWSRALTFSSRSCEVTSLPGDDGITVDGALGEVQIGLGLGDVGLGLEEGGPGLFELGVDVRSVDFGEEFVGRHVVADVLVELLEVARGAGIDQRVLIGADIARQDDGVAGNIAFGRRDTDGRDIGGLFAGVGLGLPAFPLVGPQADEVKCDQESGEEQGDRRNGEPVGPVEIGRNLLLDVPAGGLGWRLACRRAATGP